MIPKTLKVGAFTYRVITNDRGITQQGDFGETDHQSHTIRIAAMTSEPSCEETFLHEAIHTACNFSGVLEGERMTEEQFVSRISPALYTILKENGCWKWNGGTIET